MLTAVVQVQDKVKREIIMEIGLLINWTKLTRIVEKRIIHKHRVIKRKPWIRKYTIMLGKIPALLVMRYLL